MIRHRIIVRNSNEKHCNDSLFQMEACSLALELLTVGFGVKKENLVVTYFRGDPEHGIPPDSETRGIWLKLG